jgi:hypothetical protein
MAKRDLTSDSHLYSHPRTRRRHTPLKARGADHDADNLNRFEEAMQFLKGRCLTADERREMTGLDATGQKEFTRIMNEFDRFRRDFLGSPAERRQ